jgi:hypothetical protein
VNPATNDTIAANIRSLALEADERQHTFMTSSH